MQGTPEPPRLIAGLLNHIFPSRCPSCERATDSVRCAPYCRSCWKRIERHSGPSCSVCGEPIVSAGAHTCASCLLDPPPFSRAVSFGLYEGLLAGAIHHFKFKRIRRLYKPLGDLLFSLDPSRADALVPVPLSIGALRSRGFNQSLLLAHRVSQKTGIPLVMDGLLKVKETPPQIGLSARERASNLGGAFRAERDFKGLRVILIDDVMTTGATAAACSRQLVRAGAEDVRIMTLARAGNL